MTTLSVRVSNPTHSESVTTRLTCSLPAKHQSVLCFRSLATDAPITVHVQIGAHEEIHVFEGRAPWCKIKQRTMGCVCLILIRNGVSEVILKLNKVDGFLAAHHAALVAEKKLALQAAQEALLLQEQTFPLFRRKDQ